MADLKDIISYLLENYPHKSELSNARVTKMVYLADWYSANVHGRQVSAIAWYFDNFGPYVPEVIDTARNNPDLFSVEEVQNIYGGQKALLRLAYKNYSTDSLSQDDKTALDKVIQATEKMNWSDFIKFVYSTHPILSSGRYSHLDLLEKAREYKELKSGTD